MGSNSDFHAGHQIISIFERAKSQLDEILDHQPGFIAVVDGEGKILRANIALAGQLGLPFSECAGTHLSRAFAPWDWKIFAGHLRNAFTNSVGFELAMFRPGKQEEPTSVYWRLEALRVNGRPDLELISILGQNITELRRTEKQLSEVFATTPVGILTIDLTGKISPHYSEFCERLFETNKIAGQNARDLIFMPGEGSFTLSEAQAVEKLFNTLGGAKSEFEELRPHLPSRILYTNPENPAKQKWLSPSYHAVGAGSRLMKILIIVEDGTLEHELGKLKEQASFLQEEATVRILQVKRCHPDLINALMYDFSQIFDRLGAIAQSRHWAELKRDLHSIKGNARIVDFNRIADLVHDYETFLEHPRDENAAWVREADALYQKLIGEWNEYKDLIQVFGQQDKGPKGGSGSRAEGKAKILDQILTRYRTMMNLADAQLRYPVDRLELALRTLNSTPLSDLELKLRAQIERVAKDQGKQATLVCNWNDVRVDGALWGVMSECFVHILNNAIAHAISKARPGTIGIECYESGDSLHIDIWDDGEGINVTRVNALALQNRLITLTESLRWSDQDLMQLIFHPGFSTAESVDQTSGRGIGLDAVARRVQQVGGSVTANAHAPKGTLFKITFPVESKLKNREFIALSDFIAQFRSALVQMNTQTGTNVRLVSTTDFDQADFLFFAHLESLILALTTTVADAARSRELELTFTVIGARVTLNVNYGKSVPFIELPPEFQVSLGASLAICFAHQGEIARRDRGMQITFGHIVEKDKFPPLMFKPDEDSDSEQLRLTLGGLKQLSGRFGIHFIEDKSTALDSNEVRIVKDGNQNAGLGVTCGAPISVLQSELVRVLGNLLR